MRQPLLATLLVLALPGTAAAATTTIGSTDPMGFDENASASTVRTIVPTASPGGGISYVVPAGTWVVRSVSAKLRTTDFPSAAVVIARPRGGNDYEAFRTFGFDDLPSNKPNAVYTQTVSAPAKGGDVVSVQVGPGAYAVSNDTAGYTHSTNESSTGPVTGDATTFTPKPGDDGAYAVSATLEPDVDGDGYGDDTQDTCPLDAERQAPPCASDLKVDFAVDKTTVVGGQSVNSVTTLTNLGPATITNVAVTIPYGQRFVQGASFDPACTNVGAATRCAIAQMNVGQVIQLAGSMRSIAPNRPDEAGTPVTETLSAFAVSDNRDLNTANNNPPAIGMTVLPQPVTGGAGGNGGNGGSGGSNGGATTCKVPALSGLTSSAAKSALTKAGCTLGKTTKPRGKTKKGYQLVVKSQSLKTGSSVAKGTKVNITLKAAKKKK